MTENTPPPQVQQPFHALLTPHRSLPPLGFLVLMGGLATVSFIAGLVFMLMGAWPVFGFFGFDLLLIYLAFRLNYRSGRLYETVAIDPSGTTVTRVHPSGRHERFDFATAWVRVNLDEGQDGRTELSLTHHGRRIVFARFLTDDERRDLRYALQGALVEARGGRRI